MQNNRFAFQKSIFQADLKNSCAHNRIEISYPVDPPDEHMMQCTWCIYSRFPWHNSHISFSIFNERHKIIGCPHCSFFGAQYRAYTLDSSGSRLPLPGLPAEFTTELPAKLYSGRTFTCWVTISNFIYLSIDSQRFGLRWAREFALLATCYFTISKNSGSFA